ncbi:hypothetical protein A2J03_15460 [Rhodococcus sp. EPR-157]|nr:hypothetical protein A2J03_15460 [Rhodococcus sp. EPR-157]
MNAGSKTKRWFTCRVCNFDWETDPDHRTRSNRGCPKCARKKISTAKSTPRPGKSFGDRCSHLLPEWHNERNGALTPFDVAPKSHRKVWWKCPFGHEWEAEVAPRTIGVGCPKCTITGASERQLRLAYELEAAGFEVDHNHPPIAVTGRSAVRADIVIPSRRLIVEYDGAHYHRDGYDTDRFQSAALTAAGWVVLRVREFPLESIGGYQVLAEPVCSIKSLTDRVLAACGELGFHASRLSWYLAQSDCVATELSDAAVYQNRSNSVSTALPEIAEQWHPSRNGDVTADRVHPGSSTRFWWLCDVCGHEWEATPATRSAGHGCSVCGHRRGGKLLATPLPGQSLAHLNPDLAQEWHSPMNESLSAADVKPFSSAEVWWLCGMCAHVWRAAVSTRSNGHGCTKCAGRENAKRHAQPALGQSLADLHPDVAKAWHTSRNVAVTPYDVKPFSMKSVWWQCESGHEWEAPVAGRTQGSGCPPCAFAARGLARSTPKAGESVADKYPNVAREWHISLNEALTPHDVKPGSSKYPIWWTCTECGHHWQAKAKDRCIGGRGCPPCGRKRAGLARALPKHGRSLADLYPAIAHQWHPTRNGEKRPETTKPGSSTKVWWRCAEGHEWQAIPKSRTGLGSGCPVCARARQSAAPCKVPDTPRGMPDTEEDENG